MLSQNWQLTLDNARARVTMAISSDVPTPSNSTTSGVECGPGSASTAAARALVELLTPLAASDKETAVQVPESNVVGILSAIQRLVPTLTPNHPIFASFHDGQVHDPLGAGSYAFRDDVVGPVLSALVHDEALARGDIVDSSKGVSHPDCRLPSRPVVVHAGLQPNNSPHVGTLIVFCYAFAIARAIRDRMQSTRAATDATLPPVSVEITFVDTAPVSGQGEEIDGVQYQRSYRDVSQALDPFLGDYEEVLQLLSTWSGVPFTVASQANFFAHPAIPSILSYMITHHELLGYQLSPKHGKLALRAACPIPGCGLADKHGLHNVYNPSPNQDATITFHCPHHGPHSISTSSPTDLARLEANAPVRNLIRSMTHLLDSHVHNVRVTGADYSGTYQEMFLYRPLAAWSTTTGLAAGRTPHILYAPLVVDWSGAKLSKSLYVRERGYRVMEVLGTDGLCSFEVMRERFGGDGARGLRRVWEEVEGWVGDPRKLFRAYSVEYLDGVVLMGEKWE